MLPMVVNTAKALFLMNPNFDCQMKNCKNGRFIILDLKADDSHLILVNIYAPMIQRNK